MSWGHALWVIPAAVVAYGFYDANAYRRVDPSAVDLLGSAASVDQLYFDSMAPYTLSDGDVFLQLNWRAPAAERVRRINVSGDVFLGAVPIGSFSGSCQRRGDTDMAPMADPKEAPWNMASDRRVCFLKTQARVPFQASADGKAISVEERARVLDAVKTVQFRNFQAWVEVSNRPMRYVSWITEQFEALRGWISAPFERV